MAGFMCSVFKNIPEAQVLCASQTTLWAAIAGTNMTLMPLLLVAEPLSFTASGIGALSAGISASPVLFLEALKEIVGWVLTGPLRCDYSCVS